MIVLDTHVLIWWVSGSPQLSAAAASAIRRAARESAAIVSAISVLEIATAVRRGRLELKSGFSEWLDDVRLLPDLRFEPVSVDIARLAGSFQGASPSDPADRIIAATAILLRTKLVTADAALRDCGLVATIW